MTTEAPQTLRVLISELIDYAGLFPPAALDMATAVTNYAAYLGSEDRFALGRFVVPVARLSEFAALACTKWDGDQTWRLSALIGDDPAADAEAIARFNDRHAGAMRVDTVEARTPGDDALRRVIDALDGTGAIYCEIAPSQLDLLPAIVERDARAKLRTGGVTAAAFPTPHQVAEFMVACREAGATFKATAGLHHPLRCERALTYDAGSERGVMHGFANVFLAAAFVRSGAGVELATRVLEERDSRAFSFGDDQVHWREQRLSRTELAQTRAEFAIAFGSCSFQEPLDDLRELRWLR